MFFMKKIKISLAMLGILLGTVTSFAFKAKVQDEACIAGPAKFVSQCQDVNHTLCCETAGLDIYTGPLNQ
jgi:hypothetical protein